MTALTKELPRLVPGVQISTFDGGEGNRFLVETANACFVVNQRMRHLLEALMAHSDMEAVRTHLELGLGESLSASEIQTAITEGIPQALFNVGIQPRKTPFVFSFTLLRAETVRQLARGLCWAYSPWVVSSVLVLFFLMTPWLMHESYRSLKFSLGPADFFLLYLGICISSLLHELGHASASAWYGIPPGDIGFGLYLIFPAFYTDVTKAWRLTPKQRAVVDLGGLYFQAGLLLVLAPIAHKSNNLFLGFYILSNLYMMLHTLNPLFKMDGYWLLSDLGRFPNLHKRTWSVFSNMLKGKKASKKSQTLWNDKNNKFLFIYAISIIGYAVFIITTLPKWFMHQIRPYPGIASTHLHAMASAWSQSDFLPFSRSFLGLVRCSLLPSLILVFLIFMLSRLVRREGRQIEGTE